MTYHYFIVKDDGYIWYRFMDDEWVVIYWCLSVILIFFWKITVWKYGLSIED